MASEVDYTRALFGEHARRVPAWLYVQDQGDGLVSFVGASHMPTDAHPLRYGSKRMHQLAVGELIVRPQLVVGTDALRGYGLAGLTGAPFEDVIAHGDTIVDLGTVRR